MYEEFETRVSVRYLEIVISSLEEPAVLLGGWAVHHLVNKNFRREQGREYIGSRDIDLGFYVDKNWGREELENSNFARSYSRIQDLKFEIQGFRLLKQIHTETGEVLSDRNAKRTPLYFIFPLYVDLIVNEIHPRFKDVFGFVPVDEPLLNFVFNRKKYVEVEKFGRRLWIPTIDVLLATKFNSVLNRDKEEKRVKDICDIFALLWFSGRDMGELKEMLFEIEEKPKIAEITKEILGHAKDISPILGVEERGVRAVFSKLLI